MLDFNFDDYYGTWRTMYMPKKDYSEGKCHSQKFIDRTTFVSVTTAYWRGDKPNQTMRRTEGRLHDTTGNSSMSISYDGISNAAYPYVVIDTDYNTYSVVYQCGISLGFQVTEKLWVMTRDGLVRDSVNFNAMSERALSFISQFFDVSNPELENEYYTDTQHWLAAPIQG